MVELLNEIAFFFNRLDWLSLIDISLVALFIYIILVMVRGTPAMSVLRGVLFLVIVIALLTTFLPLRAFSWLLSNTLPALLVAVPVLFAPEIRRALERLGRAGSGLPFFLRRDPGDFHATIETLATAAQRLSERRHGGLIIIERQVGLQNFIDSGVRLDATLSVELILQLFYPNTPLHDGAVILRGSLLTAAACIMPLTTSETLSERRTGLRHRAALGISEVSDAVALVVSEETGIISIAHNGRIIRRLDAPRLRNILAAFYRPRGARLPDREKEPTGG